MNQETINNSARNGLLWKIGRFLWLFFWEYPMRREENQTVRDTNIFWYVLIPITGSIVLFGSYPDISVDKFPTLEQATVVEGHVIRHPSLQGGSKYVSEPIAIETATGPIYKNCRKFGLRCFDNDQWKSFEGRPARLWFWNEWAIQIEVDGIVPKYASYEEAKRRLTGAGLFISMVKLVSIFMLYMLIRIGRRYFVVAYKNVFVAKN